MRIAKVLAVLALCWLNLISLQDASAKTSEFQWKLLPGYNLESLTNGKLRGQSLSDFSTAGLSWPDGRQAVVTTFRISVRSGDKSRAFLYRCIDFYNARMEWGGQGCYEARTSS